MCSIVWSKKIMCQCHYLINNRGQFSLINHVLLCGIPNHVGPTEKIWFTTGPLWRQRILFLATKASGRLKFLNYYFVWMHCIRPLRIDFLISLLMRSFCLSETFWPQPVIGEGFAKRVLSNNCIPPPKKLCPKTWKYFQCFLYGDIHNFTYTLIQQLWQISTVQTWWIH